MCAHLETVHTSLAPLCHAWNSNTLSYNRPIIAALLVLIRTNAAKALNHNILLVPEVRRILVERVHLIVKLFGWGQIRRGCGTGAGRSCGTYP